MKNETRYELLKKVASLFPGSVYGRMNGFISWDDDKLRAIISYHEKQDKKKKQMVDFEKLPELTKMFY